MNGKQQILDDLADIFNRWEVMLASLSQQQIHTRLVPSDWTIKDVVAHMWSWQQASLARAEAALHDHPPAYPAWWQQRLPDPEEDVNGTNALIYSLSKDKRWEQVYKEWKDQFTLYLELIRQVPENDFLMPGRYAWMRTFALADSSKGSLEHHQEHYEMLTAWLREHPGQHDQP